MEEIYDFIRRFCLGEIEESCLAYEPMPFDYMGLKKGTDPLWILGKQYNVHNGNDLEDLYEDIKSRIWFTYRKLFQPIGETYLTSDSGWGCMHRCGQMLLAQAMILRHFGREWKWKPDNAEEMYKNILSKFDDRPECPYSIHKIASMGSMLEKQVGQWFGPNTVVQVLKKLIEEDSDNDVSLHVAMDNMVIKSEIRELFRRKSKECSKVQPSDSTNSCNLPSNEEGNEVTENNASEDSHPVLLTIPLRLGLSEIIPVYFDKLKNVFTLKQCVGIIGGRTNHASFFIGYVGDELIYLDPHTTQPHRGDGPMDDVTYHCEHPSRMEFSQLDPSIALCFYLETEADFEAWCREAHKKLLEPEKDAVFEILEQKPAMLPYVDIEECDDYGVASLNEVDRIFTSDDEFEFLM